VLATKNNNSATGATPSREERPGKLDEDKP